MIILNKAGHIIVTKDDIAYRNIKNLLAIPENEKIYNKEYNARLKKFKVKATLVPTIKYLYTIKNDKLYIPYGLNKYIEYLYQNSEVKYAGVINHPLMDTKKIINIITDFRNILPGISLYDSQLDCIKEIFIHKRGVIQAGTGFGKSEVICATIKIMQQLNNGKFPTILLFEPTIELLKGMIKRFKKYKIPINDYRQSRMIFKNKVNLAHPTSIGNDLVNNPNILDKVEVHFVDEAHHSKSLSWYTPTLSMPNLIYMIGTSATFLSHYAADGQNIDDFSYEELRTIGAIGPILKKIDGKNLIQADILAKPKVIVFNNKADEYIDESDYEWQTIRKVRLHSEDRTRLIAKIATFLIKYNRKIIIMMNTLDWGIQIMQYIYELGYGPYVRTCYGGQKYGKINKKGKFEKEYLDVLNLFDRDRINVLVGSSTLQEGIDLKKVDGVILADVGKSDRGTLQSLGRCLRLSKTGKFAYVIDFNDEEDEILNRHYNERLIKYERVLGITNEQDRLLNINMKEFVKQFKEWENIK